MHPHLGHVQDGIWHFLVPEHAHNPVRRLTQLDIQAARTPESGELVLSEYEGCLVLVEGRDNGGWIWSAQVVDQCDAEMSGVVLSLLMPCATSSQTAQPGGAESLQIAYDALNRELAPLMANGSGISAFEEQRLEALGRAMALVGEAARLLENAEGTSAFDPQKSAQR